MNYHGLPWTTMVRNGHMTMNYHGRQCFIKWHHGYWPWSWTMGDHGHSQSQTMVTHGQNPWSPLELLLNRFIIWHMLYSSEGWEGIFQIHVISSSLGIVHNEGPFALLGFFHDLCWLPSAKLRPVNHGKLYSLSNVIMVDEKFASFHQYLRYYHKSVATVFSIPGAILWV